MHELTATSEKNRRNEESKGIRDPVRSTGVIQQNHGWRDRASAVEGAARSEIQTPDDSSGACISDLVAPSRAGPRGTPWAGVPPAPVRAFQPDLFDSSDLRHNRQRAQCECGCGQGFVTRAGRRKVSTPRVRNPALSRRSLCALCARLVFSAPPREMRSQRVILLEGLRPRTPYTLSRAPLRRRARFPPHAKATADAPKRLRREGGPLRRGALCAPSLCGRANDSLVTGGMTV